MSEAEAAAPTGETVAIEQRADLRSFLGLSLRNGLLNLVTLTLYRFWGKTEVRRRVWMSTWINGEPLEYTGRGKELFLGFLFAVAALGAPFLLVVFGVQFGGPIAALFVLPMYIFIIFLVGFGQFTAFRYLASRTLWRGVRFGLRGKAVDYGWTFLGYALLSGLSLGWFWPAAQRRLAGRLWGALSFGDRPFKFDLDRARRLEPIYPAFVLGSLAIAGLYVIGFGVMAWGMMTLGVDAVRANPALNLGMSYALVGFIGFGAIFAYAPYNAARLRSVAAGVQLDRVWFKLELNWRDMLWLSLSNVMMVVLSLGFLMSLVQARTTQFLLSRLRVHGAVDLATARQSAEAGPRTGEGLADAFGLSPI